MRLSRKLAAALLAAALVLLVLDAAVASAWRKPTRRERTLILAAGERHGATCNAVPYPCVYFIRVSTKGPWAAEYVSPPRGNQEWQAGIASFRRIGRKRWRFHSNIQEAQGCGVPKAARRDLKLPCVRG